MLTLDVVRFGFPAQPEFLGPVSLAVSPGECWAIVGPNGAGKSTLLRLMAGLLKAHAGRISLGGEPLTSMSPRRRAQRIAFVPQQAPTGLDLSVRDVVLMGRFPHRSLGLFESAEDYRIAERAMALTEMLAFADRPLATLSGGEAQRVHLAAALAQTPDVILADEPTASLDLQHQLAVSHILRDRAERDGLAVVLVTHDVNLAARFCTRVLLMHEGRAVKSGSVDAVLTPEVLAPVYHVELLTLSAGGDQRWIVPAIDRTEAGP